eukprot:5329320-Alexandrium_andersonii.AAC.1
MELNLVDRLVGASWNMRDWWEGWVAHRRAVDATWRGPCCTLADVCHARLCPIGLGVGAGGRRCHGAESGG